MSRHRLICLLASVAVLVIAATAAAGAASGTGTAAPKKITARGVGQVKLGETFRKLRAHHLVRKLTKGCPLGGPNTRSAKLKPPLKGIVNFTLTTPRKVVDISLGGGATARGVGIGATIADIKAAFPAAVVDHSTEHIFGTTLVKIPKRGGGRIQFAVDVKTKKVVLIGVPFIAVCE